MLRPAAAVSVSASSRERFFCLAGYVARQIGNSVETLLLDNQPVPCRQRQSVFIVADDVENVLFFKKIECKCMELYNGFKVRLYCFGHERTSIASFGHEQRTWSMHSVAVQATSS